MTNPFEDQTPDNVKAMRLESGKTREQAAAICQVKPETWKSWELGRRPAPPGTLATFAKAVWAEQDAIAEQAAALEQAARQADLLRLRSEVHHKAPSVPRIWAKLPFKQSPPGTPDHLRDRNDPEYFPQDSALNNLPTPEDMAASAKDLANGFEYSDVIVAQAKAQFEKEQRNLAAAADSKALAERERSAQILAGD